MILLTFSVFATRKFLFLENVKSILSKQTEMQDVMKYIIKARGKFLSADPSLKLSPGM